MLGLFIAGLACASEGPPPVPTGPVLAAYRRAYLLAHPAIHNRYRGLRRFLLGTGGIPEAILSSGQTIAFLVRDPGGEKLGVLKPSAGNTDARSEVFLFRLAMLLGVPGLVTHAASWNMPVPQVRGLREILIRDRFQGAKERARRALLPRVEASLESKRPLAVAVKCWRPAITYWHAAGGARTGGYDSNNPLAKAVLGGAPQPSFERFLIRQNSSFASPLGRYQGWGTKDRLAAELATIMLLDALAGNADRFPGGNLHLSSLGERSREVAAPNSGLSGSRRFGSYDLGEVSLLALDNGSGLRNVAPARSKAMLAWEHNVSRVDLGIAARLRRLEAFLAGRSPSYREFESIESVAKFLALGSTRHPFWNFFCSGLVRVVARFARLEEKYPGGEWTFRRPLRAVFPKQGSRP